MVDSDLESVDFHLMIVTIGNSHIITRECLQLQPAGSKRRTILEHVLMDLWAVTDSFRDLRVRECKLVMLCSVGPVWGNCSGLKRGNTLTLCPERYARLNRLWLNHGIAEEVTGGEG